MPIPLLGTNPTWIRVVGRLADPCGPSPNNPNTGDFQSVEDNKTAKPNDKNVEKMTQVGNNESKYMPFNSGEQNQSPANDGTGWFA